MVRWITYIEKELNAHTLAKLKGKYASMIGRIFLKVKMLMLIH